MTALKMTISNKANVYSKYYTTLTKKYLIKSFMIVIQLSENLNSSFSNKFHFPPELSTDGIVRLASSV